MLRPLAVTVVILFASVAAAGIPTSIEHVSVVDRPPNNFYNAIAGRGAVKVQWEVSPTSIPRGSSITLTLIVTNAVNPHEIIRPPLLELPGFADLFSAIEDLPDETPPSGEVRFRYKATPRNEGVNLKVPELTFSYYQPHTPPGLHALTARALAVPFTVTKPVVPDPPSTPLVGPPEFFVMRPDGTLTRSGAPDWWLWAVLFTVGLVVLTGWVFIWRRLYPDAARLAAIRRHRAVRIALDRLRWPNVTPDAVAITLRNYLIARFGLSFTAQTPGEVATGLAEVGVPPERAAEVENLLRDCDAARFAGPADIQVSAKRVAEMIERWEGVR